MSNTTQPATVLIVDDEQDLADVYAAFLEPRYTVVTAYNGTEALDKMNDEVDVALLDRRMPGLSGAEVLQAIREAGFNCRVAMVTAVTPDIDIIEMGFDDYLIKPVDRKDLYETVEQLLELNSYDHLMEEYYQLASKKAALQTGNPDTDFSVHAGFTQLTERLDELKDDLDETLDSMSRFDIRSFLDRA